MKCPGNEHDKSSVWWRPLVVLSATLAVAAAVVLTTLRMLLPTAPPPSVGPTPARHAPLTKQLVFVVVDGLRHDVAVDGAWMPRFAEAMRRHSSAEIWCGPVSMTSSAVLSYSTGQNGDLYQIVHNETARATPYEHLPGNARVAGLRTAATGDVAWFFFHPGVWDLAHPDPEGVAMDVDYNPEIFAAAREFLAAEPRVSLLVVHFVTPDHQAHVHGVQSEGYRAHIRDFDEKLHQLLSEVPPDATVIVTSDHGANDRGKHGADSPLMRRSPIYAYGPGIRPGWHPAEPLRQIDLPDTMAYLLGIAAPAHGHGHVLSNWLDVPPRQRAAAACESLARIERLASAWLGSPAEIAAISPSVCHAAPPARNHLGSSELAVAGMATDGIAPAGPSRAERSRAGHSSGTPSAEVPSPGGSWDEVVAETRTASEALAARMRAVAPAESHDKWLALCLVAIAAVGIGLLGGTRPWRRELARWAPSLLVTIGVIAAAVLLTRHIESLPGRWSAHAPGTLMVIAYLAMVATVLRLTAVASWLDRHAPLAAAMPVVILASTYTMYTQPLGYVAVALVALLLLVPPLARRVGLAGSALVHPARAVIVVALWAGLWRLVHRIEHYLPEAILRPPWRTRALIVVAVAAFAVERLLRRRAQQDRVAHERRAELAAALILAATAVTVAWLRGSMALPVGLAAWLGGPLVGWWLWTRGWRTAAELAVLTSCAAVARPPDLVILMATFVVAEVVGDAAGRALAPSPDVPRPSVVAALVGFVFALMFVQRLGVGAGVDFTHTDWAAGTFGGKTASYFQIGAANVTKHLIAAGSVLAACTLPLGHHHRRAVIQGVLAVQLLRALVLCAMLFVCRRSFWTALRVLSDLPYALVAAVAAAIALAWLLLSTPATRSRSCEA